MNRPDFTFWMNIAKVQVFIEEIKKTAKYEDIEGAPMDLNDIPNSIKGKMQIATFKYFATKLEDQALELVALAEEITLYTAQMEANLDEKENESLPDEGNPGYAIGA